MNNKTIETKEKDGLIKVCVRLSPEALEVIDAIAKRNNKTRSETIRLTLDGGLFQYLSKVMFVEHDDALEYQKCLTDIFSEMEVIGSDIHRIGVNYNQEIKLKNIQKKYAHMSNALELKMAEEQEIKKECLPASDLKDFISRYEKATAKVGEQVCRILG